MDYKEKLRLAKEALDSGSYDRETIECIFPELKESENEDDRIRNFLISKMKAVGNVWKEYSSKDIIAWLEKQGEQKQVPITDEWIEDYWKHHKVTNPNSYDKGDEVQFDHDGFVRFCNKYFQKPTWSEEDENMLQKALSTIRYALSIPADKEDDPCFAGSSTIAWLKSLKERMKGE